MVDFLRGVAILVGFNMAGVGVHRLGVPLPSGVLGLLLLFLALSLGVVKLDWVEGTAMTLLRHMVLLFVPLTVGLIAVWSVVQRQALALTASLVVSFVAVLLVTGLLGKALLQERVEDEPGELKQ
ncbi:MAG TPA: CidA/LrgA family protein [Terracidiphilus sp.]|nr:CidA/LrgA family protein [Terracidiphilus sp.]